MAPFRRLDLAAVCAGAILFLLHFRLGGNLGALLNPWLICALVGGLIAGRILIYRIERDSAANDSADEAPQRRVPRRRNGR